MSVSSNPIEMSLNESSEDPMDKTLDQLNYEKVRTHFGAVAILAFLIIPGIIGNSHVLHIYITKKPKHTTRVFVIFLAMIDLVACTVCFPSIMINYLMPLKIYKSLDAFCRILTFLTIFVTIGEAISLLAIAVDRYRRICEPFKRQMNINNAKAVCLLIIALTIVLTIPVPVLIGSAEKFYPNVTGYECNVLPEHRGSMFEKGYYGVMVFVSFGACIILPVLYSLIGWRVWKHQTGINAMKGASTTSRIRSSVADPENEMDQPRTLDFEMTANETSVRGPDTDQSESTQLQTASTEETSCDDTSEEMTSTVMKTLDKGYKQRRKVILKRKEIRKFKRLKKPIYQFTLLAFLYVLSYIPYPLLRLHQVIDPEFYKNPTYPEQVAFHMTRCFLFLNHVINSFIYMIFDEMYRRELKSFYSSLFCRK